MLVSCILLAASCAAISGNSAQQHFAAGDAYFDQRRFAEAIIEYRSALQKDPRLAPARLKLARAYIATDDYTNGFREYLRAGDQLTDDLDVQTEVGNMLLLGRRFEDAKSRARAILQKDPSHLGGLTLLGNALAGLQDFDSAASVAERAAGLDSERFGSYMNLGALQLARGDHQEAEEAFKRAVALNPKSPNARLSLANFYRAVGDVEGSEREFHRALELDPTNFQANRTVASFYIERNLPQRAEPYLRRVAETLNHAASWLELADLLVAARKPAEALKAVERVSDPRHAGLAKMRIASITHAVGRTEEAHAILDELLERDPNNAEALALDARLLLAEGRIDHAMTRARAALHANPNSEDAHFVLGKILVARKDLESAWKAFNEVRLANPGSLRAHIEISNIHLMRREIDSAVQVAREASRLHPQSLDAKLAVIRSLMTRSDDHPKAQQEVQQLVRDYPASPPARVASGRFLLATGNATGARREFERALEIDRTDLDALAQLVALDMSSGRAMDARKRLVQHLEQQPNNPALLLMCAKVAVAQRQLGQAEQLLRRVIQVDRSSLEAYALLGQLFVAAKRLPQATREFAAIAERDPQSAAAHTMLGLLLHAQRHVDEAAKHYEKAVESDPQAATAANNLAWLLAENDRELDRALQLAQSARAVLPNQPEVTDTLGWVYVKRDMLPLAIPLLEETVQRAPENPLYSYHLGVAYAKYGDDAKSRKALERALSVGPNFARAEDAKRILSTLVY